MGQENFDQRIRPLMPAESVTGDRRTLRFDAPAVAEALANHRVRLAAPAPESDDPLLVGGSDSPGLERYRQAKATLAEMEAAERQGKIIEVDVVVELLRPCPAIFRSAADRARRKWGNDIGDYFNEIVDEYDTAMSRALDKLEDGRRAKPTPAVRGPASESASAVAERVRGV
jgi:hypothetical protein